MTIQRDSAPAAPMVCPRCHGTYQGSKVFCPVDGARLADRLDIDAMETTPFAPAERLIDRRYEVGELIGHGTMARVYGATDLVTGKPVAVKILNRRYSQIERERKRFLREARAALAIDHPSVVKVLDVGKTPDNRPFLAIEHLQGESLGECLRRRGTLPIELALKLVLQAAVGLGAVHRAGIVHRDVKPDNIYLLGPRDAPTGVKLFDFGLARLHHDDTSESGDIVGTAAYMAPEQVLAENVDARGDVYSLGVVLFRAITGHLPFEGPNDLELIAQQVLLPAPPPSWFLEGLDPRIDAVVVRAMSKRPEHRFPSMEPMAAALQAIEQGDAEQPPAAAQPADDVYEPVTDNGRSAIGMLRRALGMQPER